MNLTVNLGANSYDILIERGVLGRIASDEILDLNRKVFIITDSLVPSRYAEKVAEQCSDSMIYTVESGEGSKSFATLQDVLSAMLKFNMTRQDLVIAVGGGVVGDLSGFAASVYMRGIDFYNIPTTLLSQIDSSIGGKTAVNFDGVKNIIGAFYQPKKVVIDPEVLSTLPDRQISNGIAEIIKMAVTFDKELFSFITENEILSNLEEVIYRALDIKRRVVELDEKEAGLRKVLNFGHTLGHGVEAQNTKHGLYHGECVAIGMLPMCSDEVRTALVSVLKKYNLPTTVNFDKEKALETVMHDKKSVKDAVQIITVNEIGSYEVKTVSKEEIKELLDRI